MVNIQMTGQQIHNVLDDAVDIFLDPGGSWGAYPRVSGLRFDVNEGLPKGSRINTLEVNPKIAGVWAAIEMDKTYTVVTNSHIALDGYYKFGNIPAELKVDTYAEYAQTFIEYAREVKVLSPVSEDNVSTTQNKSFKFNPTSSATTRKRVKKVKEIKKTKGLSNEGVGNQYDRNFVQVRGKIKFPGSIHLKEIIMKKSCIHVALIIFFQTLFGET